MKDYLAMVFLMICGISVGLFVVLGTLAFLDGLAGKP